jgi:broad specificity phosphatase PhoE
VVASQVHLVRHGEVFNPDGILYGRLPGFGLSKLGHKMARKAADDLAARDRTISALLVSPLQRTQESAAPIAAAFELPIQIEGRIIEPTNHFEGMVMQRAVKEPRNWPYLVNPFRPSWGEPYSSIVARMRSAIDAAFDSVDDGDVVLVSHQLPIWMTHLSVAGEHLFHNPAKRRCNLSSITTLALRAPEPSSNSGVATGSAAASDSRVIYEVSYTDPARELQQDATDVGAV